MAEFRLSNLLRLRKLESDQAAAGLAGANLRARETEAAVSRTYRHLAQYSDEAMDVENLRAIAATRQATASMLDELRQKLTDDDSAAARAQADYRDAEVRNRTLGKLESRWRDEAARHEASAEQNALDEITIARARRGVA
ncbi:flagellar FliJ family protein [Gryllotalpicola sp.]|uniref:flagellar FliJ family protein n=1 Tax=Gryllotalpicola sp. TaxID=1932787 RepID=UPI00262935F2|nr:flagellar FliJ family protein [Gryllotalpicola sp.]